MEIELKITKKFDVDFLQVNAGVRYWDDSEVNGIEDTAGDLIPCRVGDEWCPLIRIDNGEIINWKEGVEANIHYKVCDDGSYSLLDSEKKEIIKIDGYVPKMMSPKESGYGDYIIMNIEANGMIVNFKPSFDEFTKEED